MAVSIDVHRSRIGQFYSSKIGERKCCKKRPSLERNSNSFRTLWSLAIIIAITSSQIVIPIFKASPHPTVIHPTLALQSSLSSPSLYQSTPAAPPQPLHTHQVHCPNQDHPHSRTKNINYHKSKSINQ